MENKPDITIVIVIDKESGIDSRLSNMEHIESVLLGEEIAEIVIVDIGAEYEVSRFCQSWRERYPDSVKFLIRDDLDYCEARNLATTLSSSHWVTYLDHRDGIVADHIHRLITFLSKHESHQVSLAFIPDEITASCDVFSAQEIQSHEDNIIQPILLSRIPHTVSNCFFRHDILSRMARVFDNRVRSDFSDIAMIIDYVIHSPDQPVGIIRFLGHAERHIPALDTIKNLPDWRDQSTYTFAIIHGYLRPLEKASKAFNVIPVWVKTAIVESVQWYFRIEKGMQAPTAAISKQSADEFHRLIKNLMRYIETGLVESLCIDDELRSTLLSYHHERPAYSGLTINGYDPDQELIGFSYYTYDNEPEELFVCDKSPVLPMHAKFRSCNYFRRTLLYERITWLPVYNASHFGIQLNGRELDFIACSTGQGGRKILNVVNGMIEISQIRRIFNDPIQVISNLPGGFKGLKIRALRWLSRQPWIKKRYDQAWIFTDRTVMADDNAEHLYRWVMNNRPDINAWFLLDSDSLDWERLSKEGFKLMGRSLQRKLLLLNCKHFVSSHADFATGGLSRTYYGDLLDWKFTYLSHGIHQYDQSHWFNSVSIDRLTSVNLHEYKSYTGDNTPYKLTTKEVRVTGFPRHDALYQKVLDHPTRNPRTILVMPTWRSSLARIDAGGRRVEDFLRSEYARCWRELLACEPLENLISDHDLEIVLHPHHEMQDLVKHLNLPEHASVASYNDTSIQEKFLNAALMITDYSSVAFEMAYLRKPVIYYQFDRQSFFSGDHNWRDGSFFSFENDGFGPVATSLDDVISALEVVVSNDMNPEQKYLNRMDSFFPIRDGKACERIVDSIFELEHPRYSHNQ